MVDKDCLETEARVQQRTAHNMAVQPLHGVTPTKGTITSFSPSEAEQTIYLSERQKVHKDSFGLYTIWESSQNIDVPIRCTTMRPIA